MKIEQIPHGAAAVLQTLKAWTDAGWFRQLDSAFPLFLHQLHAEVAPELLWASALLTHMEGRGHTCVSLETLLQPDHPSIDWPPEARAAIRAVWQHLPTDPAHWLAVLQDSPLVQAVWSSAEVPADAAPPLVLGGSRSQPLLYLRRYWHCEQQVAQGIRERVQTVLPQTVPAEMVRDWIHLLFSNNEGASPPPPVWAQPDWQRIACAVALRRSFTVITGGPGTGKTYTAARLLALLFLTAAEPTQLRVALAAPTGKAAARLSQSIDGSLTELQKALGDRLDLRQLTERMGKARTVHSLLGSTPHSRQFRYHAAHPLDVDVLIVDETSMIHLEMMAALLAALPSTAKLIVLGDKDQLASVEAGSVLGDLCAFADQGGYSAETAADVLALSGEHIPTELLAAGASGGAVSALAQQTVKLRYSRRFSGAIGRFATAVNKGWNIDHYPAIIRDGGSTVSVFSKPPLSFISQFVVGGDAVAPMAYATYLEVIRNVSADDKSSAVSHQAWVTKVLKAFDQFRVLCAVHEGDWGDHALNAQIQQALQEAKLLIPKGEWFVGRPVIVTKNDPALGVFNGDVGVVLPAFSSSTSLRVYFLDGEALRSVSVSRLAHVETAFAMTVHKSQGSEFMHTLLVLPPEISPVVTRQLVYTGITRAREHFTLVEGGRGVLQKAVRTLAARASGLQAALQSSTTAFQ